MKHNEKLIRGTELPETVEHSKSASVDNADTEDLPWGLPVSFSGALPVYRGRHRSAYSTLQSATDGEAVAEWLREKAGDSKPTARAYRREAERLLIWSATTRSKSLSDLDRNDYVAYREFLSDPGPEWIMDKRYSRSELKWRPFMGPLTDKSRYYALTVVFSLVKFLTDTGWLRANPMPSPKKPRGLSFNPLVRSLSQAQKDYMHKAVGQMPEGAAHESLKKARAEWMLAFFLMSAARTTEACTHTMSSISRVPTKESSIWVWRVIGKGDKEALVPLPQSFIRALIKFRQSLSLSPYPTPGETIPLIPSLRSVSKDGEIDWGSVRPITSRQVLRIIKDIMQSAAAIARTEGDDYEAESLATTSSTHWLRHTNLRDVADQTGDMRMVQAMGRHANINTSAIYSTKDLDDLAAALEGIFE